ncbi:MAG: OmpA family protein, partial [Dokdonia donghaensis]|nr:OmpA family protein [Dokdonia donghaensis]
MKHLSRFLVAALMILALGSVNAQDANNPWAISVGANAIDTYPVGDALDVSPGAGELRGNLFEEFYNVEDHWSIVPSVSYVNVSRYLGDGFTFGVSGSLNRIDKLGDERPRNELQ